MFPNHMDANYLPHLAKRFGFYSTCREKKKSLFLLWMLRNVRDGNIFMPIQQGRQKI